MNKEVLISYFPNNTYKRYQAVTTLANSWDDLIKLNSITLRHIGWNDQLIAQWNQWKTTIDVDKIQQTLEKEQIVPIPITDPQYPPLLKQLYDPPICLFTRGTIQETKQSLAIVGTRKNTPYGKQITELIVKQLVPHNIPIVSGLAFGIDAIAHQTTIQEGGYTIAVLGGGVDTRTIAPQAHQQLATAIITQQGAIISEYPPYTKPTSYSFPKRNRIIAGITTATLVIEAGTTSGALITADVALQYGKDVYAIPQNITSSTSIGVNTLIKQGAIPITCGEDILEAMNVHNDKKNSTTTQPIHHFSKEEKTIYQLLSQNPIHIDILLQESSLSKSTIMNTLTLLEIGGHIQNVGNMCYIRRV